MKKERRLGSRIFMGLIFLFLYAPILLMIVFSFNDGNSNVVWQGFSLRWYEQLFHDRAIIQSVYTTLLVSALATVIATIAGTFAAVGFYSMRRRTRSMLLNVNNIPMMNADIVTGVSLCMLWPVERICRQLSGDHQSLRYQVSHYLPGALLGLRHHAHCPHHL